jgi:hypothetical protein
MSFTSSDEEGAIFPSPSNMGRAPLWMNYVTAQTSQAALGLIPRNALAVGVKIAETEIEVIFQMSKITKEDEEDISDVVDYLQMLLGFDVDVHKKCELRDQPDLPSSKEVSWIYTINERELDAE